jgi:Domain of unknown function (DUF4157)
MSGKSTAAVSAAKSSLNVDRSGLLQRKCDCGNAAGLTGKCSGCQSKRLTKQPDSVAQTGSAPVLHELIQPKLTVGEPDDKYEQEADRVADRVMRMPESSIQRLSPDRDPSLENAVVIEGGEENEAEQEQGLVQTLRPRGQISGREEISKGLLNSSQGGVPLGSNVRQFMEPRFGADFGRVQVHADRRAAELSQSLSARAFAYGRHIYFNEGEYQPETQEGKRVLAHELTHVIQQGGSQTRLPVQQHVTESRGANMSATIQRLGKLGKELNRNVAPWGSGPTGSDYEVSTDSGSTVTGWKGYPVWKYELLFWCHGHSLGTFYKYGYSIYSGPSMAAAVKDEWTTIPPDQTKAGDIAVWTAGFDHSAKFTKPVIEKGQLVHDKSELSTKNGQNPLAVKTLTNIMGTYGSAGVAVFHHK